MLTITTPTLVEPHIHHHPSTSCSTSDLQPGPIPSVNLTPPSAPCFQNDPTISTTLKRSKHHLLNTLHDHVWRHHLRLISTFALSVMEPWEQLFALSLFSLSIWWVAGMLRGVIGCVGHVVVRG